jgi:methionyl-tRNA formyltransferase
MARASEPALRLVFMGTAEFAVPSLQALAAGPHTLVAVYSQPPRPAGRGLEPRPSPVARSAARLGLPVRCPASLRAPEAQATFAALEADLAVVAAYGLILPPPVLAAPRLGCINLHASLLPRWRGAALIQRALLAGDDETGITIFQIEAMLDSGPIIAMERIPITPQSTAATLHDELAELAAGMLPAVVDALAVGDARARPQPAVGVTYAPKLDKAEGRLDWSRSAALLERQLRALNPWPGCWTDFRGMRLRVLAGTVVEPPTRRSVPGLVLDENLTVACGEGALRLTCLQRPGGRPLAGAEFLRGFELPPGSMLGV